MENAKWNLYVLRYNYSGNYYVGTTPNFEKRMLIHWRRTSRKKNLPEWSARNKSTEGFTYYWFHINGSGVSQSDAEQCEKELANQILTKIENLKEEYCKKKLANRILIKIENLKAEHCEKKLANRILTKIKKQKGKILRQVHVGNSNLVDNRENNYDNKIHCEGSDIDWMYEEIEKFLKNKESLRSEAKTFKIECCEIGKIGKYQKNECNKSWSDVRLVVFPDERKNYRNSSMNT